MSQQDERNQGVQTNRRSFIKGLGVAVGSSVVLGPASMGCSDASVSEEINAGMLAPDSTHVPGYFDQYTSGAYLGFSEHETTPAEVVIDVLDSRGAPRIDQVRSFVRDHELDVLLLVANASAIGPLITPLERLACPTILLDAGFSAPDPKVSASDWVFSNTLGGWESNWLAGFQLAQNVGPRGHLISSMYDASHDGILAFQAGFGEGGGRSMRLWIPDSPAMPYSVEDAVTQIADDGGDFVFIQAGAAETVDLNARLQAQLGSGSMAVASSASSMIDGPEDHDLTTLAGLEATTSWHAGATSVENQTFVRRFQAVTGRTPSPLAVLGFEAASWVGEATRQVERRADRTGLREALAAASFTGPRGAMTAMSGRLRHPFQRIRLAGAGHEALGRLAAPSDLDARMASMLPELRSGSTNAYLAI